MTLKIVDPAIYELLKPLIGTDTDGAKKLYALKAPQNVEPPFIVFQEVDSQRFRHLNGPSGPAQAFFQIDAYALLPYDAKRLGADIELALDGYRGIVYHGDNSPQDEFVDIDGISYQNGSDLPDQTDEPFLYRRLAVYLVTYKQQ